MWGMTDITKYKSVAIKIDAYQKAMPMANERYMPMGAFIRYLIDKEAKEHNRQPLENGKEEHVGTE